MQLKVKENITLWRNEGLIFYIILGFLCTLFMEVNALLPYYLQQSIIFRNADELHGLQYVIFACLM